MLPSLINNYTRERLFAAFRRHVKQLHFLGVRAQKRVSAAASVGVFDGNSRLQGSAGSITAANSLFSALITELCAARVAQARTDG